jgi:hypothetical protein
MMEEEEELKSESLSVLCAHLVLRIESQSTELIAVRMLPALEAASINRFPYSFCRYLKAIVLL